ncbi:class V lanthionine synthetase subunit LxmK [Streptomyces sp. NPDC020883]|uniref:class V lanthionine synthetase subunit LxmK n=1 Tax=Streptomyces sp. NPDC020883 TaxID=3365099 RepID=UPI003798859F
MNAPHPTTTRREGHAAPAEGTPVEPALQRYRPTDLSSAPQVGALLERLGLGPLDPARTVSFGGRNDNWAGPTASGTQVFVKTVRRASDGSVPELDRSLAFQQAAAHLPPGSPLMAPALLGSDRDAALIAFELLQDSHSGSELALDGAFDEDLCAVAGRAIGALHALPDGAVERHGPTMEEPPLPPLRWLEALPWHVVRDQSMAQIEAWRLTQDDSEVMAALRRLRSGEKYAPRTSVHCDLRFDQFVRHHNSLYLCDWEEFRLADPARDVGAFAGEWLFHATYSVFAPARNGEEDAFTGFGLTHEEIVERGARSLRRFVPRITAFWNAYRRQRTPDPELAARATSFAGWHMFDRLIATAQSHAQLNPVARAAAGIGRSCLLAPHLTAPAIGLATYPQPGVPR